MYVFETANLSVCACMGAGVCNSKLYVILYNSKNASLSKYVPAYLKN